MDFLDTLLSSQVLILVGILLAFLLGGYALISYASDDGRTALMSVGFIVLMISGMAIYSSSFTEPDRLEQWVAYRDAKCKQIERHVIAGQQGETLVGVAGTSKGLAPAVGFTSGTEDRVVTGWECEGGKVYTTSNNAPPTNFELTRKKG